MSDTYNWNDAIAKVGEIIRERNAEPHVIHTEENNMSFIVKLKTGRLVQVTKFGENYREDTLAGAVLWFKTEEIEWRVPTKTVVWLVENAFLREEYQRYKDTLPGIGGKSFKVELDEDWFGNHPWPPKTEVIKIVEGKESNVEDKEINIGKAHDFMMWLKSNNIDSEISTTMFMVPVGSFKTFMS